jgi:hypothetical protein
MDQQPRSLRMLTVSGGNTIRQAFEKMGDLSAKLELRRLCPDIQDNARAQHMVRVIIGWEWDGSAERRLNRAVRNSPVGFVLAGVCLDTVCHHTKTFAQPSSHRSLCRLPTA